ncbi:MAG: metal-dependent hydrolase [Anaerolineales bacterium]|nr:metal-dependent hydrolase [Anaerolineales bacterium]
MAQAGLHALVGAATRKITPKREWLMLGIILGSLFPDLDNYAVAVATLARWNIHGLHRTFTHSLFAIVVVLAVFTILAKAIKQPRWATLGLGFGIGIGLHIALDLLLWFNGIELLWPLGGWVNLWQNSNPPTWFTKFLEPAEFLFFALFLAWLAQTARHHKTNTQYLKTLRLWTIAMIVLLIVFTPLAYMMGKGFQTIYGAFYLVALTAVFIITIRMRQTVEICG